MRPKLSQALCHQSAKQLQPRGAHRSAERRQRKRWQPTHIFQPTGPTRQKRLRRLQQLAHLRRSGIHWIRFTAGKKDAAAYERDQKLNSQYEGLCVTDVLTYKHAT